MTAYGKSSASTFFTAETHSELLDCLQHDTGMLNRVPGVGPNEPDFLGIPISGAFVSWNPLYTDRDQSVGPLAPQHFN